MRNSSEIAKRRNRRRSFKNDDLWLVCHNITIYIYLFIYRGAQKRDTSFFPSRPSLVFCDATHLRPADRQPGEAREHRVMEEDWLITLCDHLSIYPDTNILITSFLSSSSSTHTPLNVNGHQTKENQQQQQLPKPQTHCRLVTRRMLRLPVIT